MIADTHSHDLRTARENTPIEIRARVEVRASEIRQRAGGTLNEVDIWDIARSQIESELKSDNPQPQNTDRS